MGVAQQMRFPCADLKIPEIRHPEKARRPDSPQPKKPEWIRVRAPGGKGYEDTARIMRENPIWSRFAKRRGAPTVGGMLVSGPRHHDDHGRSVTRACSFCNIATGKPPEALDVFEPGRVADAVGKLGLNHVVITASIATISTMAERSISPMTIRAIPTRAPTPRSRS